MATSYSKFAYDDLGVKVALSDFLDFDNIQEVKSSDFLQMTLERNLKRRLRSEKAKSEYL